MKKKSSEVWCDVRDLLIKCEDLGCSCQIWARCMFSTCFTEWDIHQPNNKGDQQWGPRLCSTVPGQHPTEWDGQGRSTHPDQRRGTSHTARDSTRLMKFIWRWFIHRSEFSFSSCQIRSSLKRLRSMSGRGSTRRAELRLWRWGTKL